MKFKLIFIPVAVFLAVVTGACSSPAVEVEYLPAKGEGDSDWGMIGPDGKFLFRDEFNNCPTPVVNGFFYVNENSGFSVYRADKRPKPLDGLEGLADCGVMSEGVMPVVRCNRRIEYVDAEGKTMFTLGPVNGHEVKKVQALFLCGLAVFETDEELCGAIDSKGAVVIKPEWGRIEAFFDGYSVARDKDKRQFVIDTSGNVVLEIPEEFPRVYGAFKDGLMAAEKEGAGYGFLDLKGNFKKVPSKVDRIRDWDKDLLIYEDKEGNEGVMKMDGETVIRAKYSRLFMLPNGNFLGRKSSYDWVILDRKGDVVEDFDEKCGLLFENSLLSSAISSPFGIICEDDDEYEFRKYDGEDAASVGLDEIELDLECFDPVYSDYFDVDEAVSAFVAPVCEAGYGDYALGAPVTRYGTGSADSYRYSREMSFNNVMSGYKYSVDVTLYASDRVAYDSTPSASYYTWSFNPMANVDEVKVNIEVSASRADGLLSKVLSSLMAKGFVIASEEDGKYYMTAGPNYLIADGRDNGAVLRFMTVERAAAHTPFGIELPVEALADSTCHADGPMMY